MKRRILAGVLWFYATWYGCAMAALVFGFAPVVGPIVGAAVGLFVARDPMHLIWTRTAASSSGSTTQVSTAGRRATNPA